MVISIRKYGLSITPFKKSFLAYMECARFVSMFTTDKTNELCLLTLFYRMSSSRRGCSPLRFHSRLIEPSCGVLLQYTALRCVLHITELHVTHNNKALSQRAAVVNRCRTASCSRAGAIPCSYSAFIIRSTYIELALTQACKLLLFVQA